MGAKAPPPHSSAPLPQDTLCEITFFLRQLVHFKIDTLLICLCYFKISKSSLL